MHAQISQFVPEPLDKTKAIMPNMQIQDITVVDLKISASSILDLLDFFFFLITNLI